MGLSIQYERGTGTYYSNPKVEPSSLFLTPYTNYDCFPCHEPKTYYAFRGDILRNCVGFDNKYDNSYCVGIPLRITDEKVKSFDVTITLQNYMSYPEGSMGERTRWHIKLCKTRYENDYRSEELARLINAGNKNPGVTDRVTFWKMLQDPGIADINFRTKEMDPSEKETFTFKFSTELDPGTPGYLPEELEVDSLTDENGDSLPTYYLYVYDDRHDDNTYHSLCYLNSVTVPDQETIPNGLQIMLIDPNGGAIYSRNTTLTSQIFGQVYHKGYNRIIGTSDIQDDDGTYILRRWGDIYGEPLKLGYQFKKWEVIHGGGSLEKVECTVSTIPSKYTKNDLMDIDGAGYPLGYINTLDTETHSMDIPPGTVATPGKIPTWIYNSGNYDDVFYIKAKYEPIQYSVHYYYNHQDNGLNEDGEDIPDLIVENIKYDDSFNLPEFAGEREGYTFMGWARSYDSKALKYKATYSPGYLVEGLTINEGAIVKLYAIWKPNTYNLRVHPNGALMMYPNGTRNSVFPDRNGNQQTYFDIDFRYDSPRYLGLFDVLDEEGYPELWTQTNFDTGRATVGAPYKTGYWFRGWHPKKGHEKGRVLLTPPLILEGHMYNEPATVMTCPRCNGTAIDPDDQEICNRCEGQGEIAIPCPDCDGEGVLDSGSRCDTCRGTGLKDTSWKQYWPESSDGFYYDGKYNGNTEIYADWEPLTYTIKFVDNNKYTHLSLEDITGTYDKSVILPNFLKPLGWEFLHWEGSDGKIYYSPSTLMNPIDGDTLIMSHRLGQEAVLTLTAVWKSNGTIQVYHKQRWQTAYAYVYHNGKWNHTIPFTFTDREWRQCGGGGGASGPSLIPFNTSILGYAITGNMILGVE